MSKNKTRVTETSVDSYFATIAVDSRRNDCIALAKLMTKATREPPRMWGTRIVGFGSYHYRYESGREGDSCLVGFSSRKGDISIYGLGISGANKKLLAQLGIHKAGKGCLYLRKLSDIDPKVLERLIKDAMTEKKRQPSGV